MATTLLITDSKQITDVWAGMEIEDAAKRAPALIRLAEQAHSDLKQQLAFLKLLVAPLLDADKQDVLERYFALATRRADESMALHQQSSEILTHAAFLVMRLMKQRNAKTSELAELVEALEAGNDEHPLLVQFADRLDEQREGYTHLEQAIGDEPAGVMADMFLGRGDVSAEALEVLITALIGMYEHKTGRSVTITVIEQPQSEEEAQSA
jgi:hypothetical protein